MKNKQIWKRRDGQCCFCGEDEYSLLDAHRIVFGEDGGKYTRHNTLTVCCKCHRLIHAGKIEVLGRHYSTSGRYHIRYLQEGEEKWCRV